MENAEGNSNVIEEIGTIGLVFGHNDSDDECEECIHLNSQIFPARPILCPWSPTYTSRGEDTFGCCKHSAVPGAAAAAVPVDCHDARVRGRNDGLPPPPNLPAPITSALAANRDANNGVW